MDDEGNIDQELFLLVEDRDDKGLRAAADTKDESSPAPLSLPGCMPHAEEAEGKEEVCAAEAKPKPSVRVAPAEAGERKPSVRVAPAEWAAAPQHSPSASALQLLDKVLECDADDILWLFRSLKTRLHPDLVSQVTAEDDSDIHSTAMAISADDVVQRMETKEKPSALKLAKPISPNLSSSGLTPSQRTKTTVFEVAPIVQFSSFMYFCVESEDFMRIDVMRIGNLTERSEVHYTTVDATAKAGHKYQHTSGILVFEPEENQKAIHVPILQNDRWETTLEFVVELTDKVLNNAMLGFYLYRARVKIIDDDAFPTNKYREEVLSGDFSKMPKQSLLREYFKMVWMDEDAKCSTIKMVLVDQVHNLYFLVELLMNVYLVDFVLNLEKPEDQLFASMSRNASLKFVIALTLFPYVFLHFIDFMRLDWELSASELQRNLLRKFLNYDEASRAQLREGNLIMAMTRDSVKLVAGGYMGTVALARASGKLFMILVYQFVSPFLFGTEEFFKNSTFWVFSFGPLIVLPLMLMTFMHCRSKRNTHFLGRRSAKEDELIDHVYHTATNYRLIADYHRRPHAVHHFQELLNDYDDACTDADKVLANNEYFQKWVTLVLVAITVLFLGREVNSKENPYPLGMFLANVAICNYIGQSWAEIYQVLMRMEQVLPALLRVTWLMNLQTDVAHRMRLNRHRRKETEQNREKMRKAGTQSLTTPTSNARSRVANTMELPIDMLNITMQNIQFAYRSKGRETSFDFTGGVEIRQGSLVALVGHRGQGKTTVLKILGGVILPQANQQTIEDGQVFYVPSHLRVLHVSSEPMFFHGSLYQNLVFGVPSEDHPDAKMRRVEKICKLLTLPENVINFLEIDDHLDWDEVFSQTQLALLSLARALISNPEVLCIHKPTLFLDVKTSSTVLHLLRHFVEQKGICQDPESWAFRRPRTCIITISRHEALKVADQVYLVEEGRIREIPWQNVTPELLQ